jgi:hypothetical protein
MIVVRSLLFLRVVLLSACMSSALVAGTNAAPAEPQPAQVWPPIVFYVAKGDPNACGRGCGEWIAAEGMIDANAPRRLRDLLSRLGQRKLPIFFHSPGGSVEAGLAIGRLMRERRMTAGVGRSIPRGCDPLQEHEAACDNLKRTGRELLSELRTARTLCNSSCVYALIGAAVREVEAGARIGVHEIAVSRYDERGLPVPLDRKTLSQDQLTQLRAAEVRLARYIEEMGIDKALFEAAAQIGSERVRYLSLNEIARFGIDPREFQESRWMLDEGPPGPLAVLKFVVEAKGSEPKEYRITRIRLTCGRPAEIRVEYHRELSSADRPASIAVTTRGDAFVLAPPRNKPVLGYNDVQMEAAGSRACPSPSSRKPRLAMPSRSRRRRISRCRTRRRGRRGSRSTGCQSRSAFLPSNAAGELHRSAGGRDRYISSKPGRSPWLPETRAREPELGAG